MVQSLGLMPSLEPTVNPNALGWSALYRMFTNPVTAQVATELIPQR